MWKFATALSLAFLASGSVAVAQMKEKAPATPRSATSIECSRQADAKGLHGKVRKKFRSTNPPFKYVSAADQAA